MNIDWWVDNYFSEAQLRAGDKGEARGDPKDEGAADGQEKVLLAGWKAIILPAEYDWGAADLWEADSGVSQEDRAAAEELVVAEGERRPCERGAALRIAELRTFKEGLSLSS